MRLSFRDLILAVFIVGASFTQAQQMVQGIVVENDSTTTMPFVYIINKSNGSGTMSDNDGKFSLSVLAHDTLVCSYVGFLKAFVPIDQLKRNAKGEVLLVLVPMTLTLNPVTINYFAIKPYERDYMNNIVDRSTIRKLDYFQSPISSLYMRYSKEGKQISKLAQIFENLMIEEQVQQKLSPEILMRLTGDENLDYHAFRRYCYYVNDYYIITHDGVELYSKVMECYKHWKSEGRDQPLRKRSESEN